MDVNSQNNTNNAQIEEDQLTHCLWTEKDPVPPPEFTLPQNRNTPVNAFSEKNLEVLAWPWLYPDAKNGFGEPREVRITEADYFQNRILHSDGRWARCIPYVLWACSMLMKYKINNCVSTALRMRKRGVRLTAGDLEEDNPDVREAKFSFMHDIRGTSAYWARSRSDLLTLLRTLGVPSFFITLSADDCNWPDLMKVLLELEGDTVTDPSSLSAARKREFMQNHPVTVTRHFN